jgi:hypothetical protein
MKKILPVVVVLLAASAIFAQSKPVKVLVEGGNEQAVSREVAEKLAAKIGSTSRYALVTNETSVEVLVDVYCLPIMVEGQQAGVACSTTILYWPLSDVGLEASCVGMMSTHYSESEVAESLFDSFVRHTSDEKLSALATKFKNSLNIAIRNYPKGVQ